MQGSLIFGWQAGTAGLACNVSPLAATMCLHHHCLFVLNMPPPPPTRSPPQVYVMEQRGELHRLLGALSWTNRSDKEFERRFGVPPVAEDDEGWQASQRLQQFGLLELGKPNRTRVKTGPKAWRQELGLE